MQTSNAQNDYFYSELQDADNLINETFKIISQTERLGVNVNSLIVNLNAVLAILVEAKNDYQIDNFDALTEKIADISKKTQEIKNNALNLYNDAKIVYINNICLMILIFLSIFFVFIFILLLIWRFIRIKLVKFYQNNNLNFSIKQYKYYKLIIVTIALIGSILIASPAILNLISTPYVEPFSEFYLIGEDHTFTSLPSNIKEGHDFSVYLGTSNHIGLSTYYILLIKLKNQTDFSINSTAVSPSASAPLYEYRFITQDGQTWEKKVILSFSNFNLTTDGFLIKNVVINENMINLDAVIFKDSALSEYRFQILFELWIYNPNTSSIEFDKKYLALSLKITNDT